MICNRYCNQLKATSISRQLLLNASSLLQCRTVRSGVGPGKNGKKKGSGGVYRLDKSKLQEFLKSPIGDISKLKMKETPKVEYSHIGQTNSSVRLPGQADHVATKQFISESGLPLSHTFSKSGLVINPIIHGPPRLIYDDELKKKRLLHTDMADDQLAYAIIEHLCNCVYVYNYYSDIDTVWSSKMVSKLVKEYDMLPRESIVTVAGLGRVASRDIMVGRLEEAYQATGLQNIDMVMIECDSDTFNKHNDSLNHIVELLDAMVTAGNLKTYGIYVNVEPYCYHNPAIRETGSLQTMGVFLEDRIVNNHLPNCDLIAYSITPSNTIPATYPMLDQDPDEIDLENTQYESFELKRKHTRASVNPFTCYPGLKGHMNLEDVESSIPPHESQVHGEPTILVDQMIHPVMHAAASQILDELCPQLQSTKKIHEKVLRAVLSVGVDVVIVDSTVSSVIGKLNLKPSALLTSHDTDDIFGNFAIPTEQQLLKILQSSEMIDKK